MKTASSPVSLFSSLGEIEWVLVMPSKSADLSIVKNIINGKTEDFTELVERYSSKVFSIVGSRVPVSDIDDVAQEVFIRAFKSLKTYSGVKPFENWLAVIAIRCCCDFWRKNSRRREFYAPKDQPEVQTEWLELMSQSLSQAIHADNVRTKEAREFLKWTMNKLSLEDRTLIEMVYFEGRTLKEASEVLQWGESKTKVRAMRARNRMRDILKEITEARNG
ncbi:RNA polymerase sigma factor [Lentisphaerota bacterium ZTH]|nr:RNA polymerase sigma factor [Lentisphaerota bacterium]WET05305.1 RNA polymerase sigma factor [Lentisphaerota bacterium ZTH]